MDRRQFLLLLGGLVIAVALGAAAASYAGEGRLAIKGYDPVAYFTDAKPMIGDPQYQYELDGVVYRFASAKNLELFKADPDRYLPQFLNLCTVALSRGKEVVVDPNYWAVHDGRLYLFGGARALPIFSADPAGTISLAKSTYANISRDAALRQE